MMSPLLTAALLLLAVGRTAHGSLEGLYATLPASGQLRHIDWLTGRVETVGKPLAAAGWAAPLAGPAGIDTTGKWYFTLNKPTGWRQQLRTQGGQATLSVARDGGMDGSYTPEVGSPAVTEAVSRQEGASGDGPWYLVGVDLGDGSVLMSQPLPAYFNGSMPASRYTVDIDGGEFSYVSAVTSGDGGDGDLGPHRTSSGWTGGGGSRLLVVRLSDKTEGAAAARLLVNQSLHAVGLGGPTAYAASTYADVSTTLWFRLEGGLAGCNLTSGHSDRKVAFDDGESFTPLRYDSSTNRVYGVGTSGGVSHIAYFDDGAQTPRIVMAPAAVPTPQNMGTAAAYISDKQQFVILSNMTLAVVGISGERIATVPGCLPTNTTASCPASIYYEPFVFRQLP